MAVAWAWKGVGCRSYEVLGQGLIPVTQARQKAGKRKVVDEVPRVEPTRGVWGVREPSRPSSRRRYENF